MIEIHTRHVHADREMVYTISARHQELAQVRVPDTAGLDDVVAEFEKAAFGVAFVADLIREEA